MSPSLQRVHSLTGIVPLTVFAVIHIWQVDGLRLGRIGFFSRFDLGGIGWLVVTTAFVVLPLGLHALLGVRLALARKQEPGPYMSVGVRRLQQLSGGLLLVFMAIHLTQGWLQRVQGESTGMIYEMLRHDLAQAVYVPVYALGLAALALHSAQGIEAAGRRFWPDADGIHNLLRGVALLYALGLFLVGVNGLAHLTTGSAFVAPIAPPLVQSPH